MGLSPSSYIDLLVAEASQVRMPTGPYRLFATRSRLAECINSKLASIATLPEPREMDEERDRAHLRRACDAALELTSYLYVGGSPHPQWRRWSALHAVGLALQKQFAEAAAYGALAGEWDFVDRLSSLPPGQSSGPVQLSALLLNMDQPGRSDDPGDFDRAWNSVIAGIRSRDDARTDAGLAEIVEWWWSEAEEGDWLNFHPYSYPDFDTPVCAAAAVAKRHGYVPRDLSQDFLRYLDAGLADGYPVPLYPTVSPF